MNSAASLEQLLSQPFSATDVGDTPEGLTYVSGQDVATYVAQVALDVDPVDVEGCFDAGGFDDRQYTVREAIDCAISMLRNR